MGSRRRFATAIVLSLLFHVFLLSLRFGLPGLGLPGFELPWSERRAEASDLTIEIANALPPAAPSAEEIPEPPRPKRRPPPPAKPLLPAASPEPYVPPVALMEAPPVPELPLPAVTVEKDDEPPPVAAPPPPAVPEPRVIAQDKAKADTFAIPTPQPGNQKIQPTSAPTPTPVPTPAPTPASTPTPALISTPAPIPMPTPPPRIEPETPTPSPLEQQAIARRQAEEAAEKLAQEEARRQQVLLEQQALAKRLAQEAEARRKAAEDAARREAEALALQQQREAAQRIEEESRARQAAEERERENAKRLAMEAEQRRRVEEAARQATALALLKQQEEEQRHAQELKAQQLEEQRRQEEEKAREIAEQQKLAEQAERERATEEARRKEEEETARRQAEELERRRIEAEAARERERRLAETRPPAGSVATENAPPVSGMTRSIGSLAARALDQARNEDLLRADPAMHTPARENSPRRRSIFGSVANEVDLRAYVDAWRQKIERNGNLNYSQASKDMARGDPVVTVAIRSDGSIEDIFIDQTSGRPDLDEAVRRILRLYAPFAKFPPEMARRYDVISIRRIWSFDDRLRIVEEVK